MNIIMNNFFLKKWDGRTGTSLVPSGSYAQIMEQYYLNIDWIRYNVLLPSWLWLQLVASTGCVMVPYMQYRGLMGMLLSMLADRSNETLRYPVIIVRHHLSIMTVATLSVHDGSQVLACSSLQQSEERMLTWSQLYRCLFLIHWMLARLASRSSAYIDIIVFISLFIEKDSHWGRTVPMQ